MDNFPCSPNHAIHECTNLHQIFLSYISRVLVNVSSIRNHSIFSIICFAFSDTFPNPILEAPNGPHYSTYESNGFIKVHKRCFLVYFWFYILFLLVIPVSFACLKGAKPRADIFTAPLPNSSTLCCVVNSFWFQDFACIVWLVFSFAYYFHFSPRDWTCHFIIQSHSIMRAFHSSSRSAFDFITMNNSASSANLVAPIITLFTRSFKNMLNSAGPCGTLPVASLYCKKYTILLALCLISFNNLVLITHKLLIYQRMYLLILNHFSFKSFGQSCNKSFSWIWIMF